MNKEQIQKTREKLNETKEVTVKIPETQLMFLKMDLFEEVAAEIEREKELERKPYTKYLECLNSMSEDELNAHVINITIRSKTNKYVFSKFNSVASKIVH